MGLGRDWGVVEDILVDDWRLRLMLWGRGNGLAARQKCVFGCEGRSGNKK